MSASPEDILSSSLQSLYSCIPVAFSDAGSPFTHVPSGITVLSPDPAPSNWSLHASSLWIGSLFLASHLDDINVPALNVNVLELGAGTGLPGILFAKCHPNQVRVTLSDYPDDNILRTLEDNVKRNGLSPHSVQVAGHAWGESTASLGVFDIILAADTLWNSDMHMPFIQTLSRVLRKSDKARAYLVAGLHTGRWVVRRFLERLEEFGLSVERVKERRVNDPVDTKLSGPSCGTPERDWAVERDEEDENERRKWVIWIVIEWADAHSFNTPK